MYEANVENDGVAFIEFIHHMVKEIMSNENRKEEK
jgi:hypothetical protein